MSNSLSLTNILALACLYSIALGAVFGAVFGTTSAHAQSFQVIENGEVLKDPTKPFRTKQRWVAKQADTQAVFTLNYVMSSGNNRRAMVNGKKVTEGAYVSGAKVIRITSDSVTLLVEGKQRTLSLGGVKGIRRH